MTSDATLNIVAYNMSYILPTTSLVLSATSLVVVIVVVVVVVIGVFPLISPLSCISLVEGQPDNSNIRRMPNISAIGTVETSGSISGLIYSDAQYNARVKAPEILFGKWDLKVTNGGANFTANFDQIAISGDPSHKVEITNLTAPEGIELTGDTTRNRAIRGTADIIFDEQIIKKTPIEILFNKSKVIEIHLRIDNLDPFRGRPITGLINQPIVS